MECVTLDTLFQATFTHLADLRTLDSFPAKRPRATSSTWTQATWWTRSMSLTRASRCRTTSQWRPTVTSSTWSRSTRSKFGNWAAVSTVTDINDTHKRRLSLKAFGELWENKWHLLKHSGQKLNFGSVKFFVFIFRFLFKACVDKRPNATIKASMQEDCFNRSCLFWHKYVQHLECNFKLS